MRWRDLQSAFGEAVRAGNLAVPDEVVVSRPDASRNRFNVYRNNHVVSLIEALGTRFPVVKALVGDEFFQAMARVFVDQSPPRTPVIIRYGEGFPDFIAAFPPAEQLPFLGDVARLEWAIGESYHAPDAPVLAIEALAKIDPAAVGRARLALQPSLRLVSSEWPVFSIWSAHQGQDAKTQLQDVAMIGEVGVTVRPQLDVEVLRIEADAYRFISLLNAHETLEDAAAALELQNAEGFAELLQFVFGAGLVARIAPSTNAADDEGLN
ncbi:MAG: DNA-binding domain-containing protein [Pseudomonadota bacterium]